jgi:hypothetical protein
MTERETLLAEIAEKQAPPCVEPYSALFIEPRRTHHA